MSVGIDTKATVQIHVLRRRDHQVPVVVHVIQLFVETEETVIHVTWTLIMTGIEIASRDAAIESQADKSHEDVIENHLRGL